MDSSIITAAELRRLLNYHPDTGLFTWAIRRQSCSLGGQVGSLAAQGYVRVSLAGRRYQLHRLAWLHHHGIWPTGEIDHINGLRNDNRIANLRDVTRSVNHQNQKRAQSRNPSKLLGVTAAKNGYQAQLGHNKKTYYLGRFATPEEAHAAYIEAKRLMHPGCTI